jgi:hypothetical protein
LGNHEGHEEREVEDNFLFAIVFFVIFVIFATFVVPFVI